MIWKKLLKRKCDHYWVNYRHKWVEYIPTSKNSTYNREGAYILSHVYCADCGEIREVVNEGKRVRYKPVT